MKELSKNLEVIRLSCNDKNRSCAFWTILFIHPHCLKRGSRMNIQLRNYDYIDAKRKPFSELLTTTNKVTIRYWIRDWMIYSRETSTEMTWECLYYHIMVSDNHTNGCVCIIKQVFLHSMVLPFIVSAHVTGATSAEICIRCYTWAFAIGPQMFNQMIHRHEVDRCVTKCNK